MASAAIPPGYNFSCISGKYYKLYPIPGMNWTQAHSHCSQDNAKLATLHGSAGKRVMNWAIDVLFQPYRADEYYWPMFLDGTDVQTEGTWIFQDGSVSAKDKLFHVY
jgi:hypothetical protein